LTVSGFETGCIHTPGRPSRRRFRLQQARNSPRGVRFPIGGGPVRSGANANGWGPVPTWLTQGAEPPVRHRSGPTRISYHHSPCRSRGAALQVGHTPAGGLGEFPVSRPFRPRDRGRGQVGRSRRRQPVCAVSGHFGGASRAHLVHDRVVDGSYGCAPQTRSGITASAPNLRRSGREAGRQSAGRAGWRSPGPHAAAPGVRHKERRAGR